MSCTCRLIRHFLHQLQAVCVTGLVVQDTGSYWSIFGQAVILALIQIGGLGVVTVAVSVFVCCQDPKNIAHAAEYDAGCYRA